MPSRSTIMPNPTPWSVERVTKDGYRGISIKAADGTYVANMVFQLTENEMANARAIVAAVNASAERVAKQPELKLD